MFAVAASATAAMCAPPVTSELTANRQLVDSHPYRLDAPRGAHLPFAGSAQAVCGRPSVGVAQCLADVLHPSNATPESNMPSGLSPSIIESVYGFATPASAGSGQTIALVDANGDPNAAGDLDAFSAEYGLPSECTGGSSPPSCFDFTQVNETGGASLPASDPGWDLEISLDIEWAHALAPGANILLVEAASSNLSDLLTAEQYAAENAKYVSNSWGSPEFAGEEFYDSDFTTPGVSYFAAAGDSGGTVSWPSASPKVISVGGTGLTFSSGGTLAGESAWASGGGGCSSYETASAYQATGSVNCSGMRATPDVSLDADPDSGVSVYDSVSYEGQSGWWTVGGTSASTPMVTARAAVNGTEMNAEALYANPSNIPVRDIVTGNNGYPTLPGYDLATGLGAWSATPGAPVLGATAMPGGVTLNWSRPSGAPVSDYRIWRGASSGDESSDLATVDAPTTTYTDSSLSVGSTGYYEVQAVNGLGVGPFSDEASGSPTAPVPAYTVSFVANGGTGSMTPETDSEPTPLTPDAFSKSGYSFAGWNTAADGAGTAYADGATYPFSESVTLYAQWTAEPAYTVSFVANGGTGSMTPETASEPTPLTPDAFSKSGCSFAGWNTAADGAGTAYAEGATYLFARSITLYAQWVANTTDPPSSPTVTSAFPVFGPLTGGTLVTLTGTGFSTIAGDTAIDFGTTPGSMTSCSSTTRCTAISPGGAAGTVRVLVRTPAGSSATSSSDTFTYEPRPTVSSLTPRSGPTTGGTRVTIRGNNFVGTVTVRFGGQLATSSRVLSSSEITTVAPGASGTVPVTVSAAGGSNNNTADSTFTFVSTPSIAKITPNEGPTKGGTKVTIWGHNFVGVISVYFGAKRARGIRVLSSKELVAIAPARAGAVHVTVITSAGSTKAAAMDRFNFVAPPAITEITTTSGRTVGGTRVLIWGHNFFGKVSVHFGADKARDVHVLTSSVISATAPPSPGVVYVIVSAAGGSSKKSPTSRYLSRVM